MVGEMTGVTASAIMPAVSRPTLKPEHALDAIARRLIATRQALGLSATEVWREMSWNSGAYHNWEAGARRPNLTDMILYADRFGLTLDWIYRGDPSGLPLRLGQAALEKLRAIEAGNARD